MDILFLNLHRRYINLEPTHGGFLGIYLLAAFVRREGFDAKSFSGTLERGLKLVDELCSARRVSLIGLSCDFDNVTENIFLSRHIREMYQLPVIV
ncbi:MAG: radical SAM protein, partial [Selenomonadaceae bacterium]|nr:radical SAM protein [Selenomonadaceae bacterium]